MDKRKRLEAGTILPFPGMACEIDSVAGCGSNAMVYRGHYRDLQKHELLHQVLIKELFPYEPDGKIYRDETGKICVQPDAIWNGICTIPVFLVITVVLWLSTLGVVKKCFIQFLQGQERVSSGAYSLRGTAGPFAGRELQIRQTVLIGRKGECGICLPGQTPGVSGIHCRIVYQENQLYITDAGSTYGTYVNNVRIQPKVYQKLKDGDQVMLGSAAVAFVVCQR